MELIEGDCLEVMKDLSDNSVDFLFCDLPYGQTSCRWDCLIDLDLFWKQVNRVCKQDAVMAFTCSVKFGNTLINSNPKCFRYDLVWVKSAACGFLNAKKMPMKKHEMVYIFYRKLAKVYTENIALHHTHKFLKETPNSVIKEELCNYDVNKNAYGGGKEGRIKISKNKEDHQQKYNPPLPNSVIKEETFIRGKNKSSTKNDVYNSDERFNSGKLYHHDRKLQKGDDPIYDPPLPNSVIKEENVVVETRDTTNYKNESDLYGNIERPDFKRKNNESMYKPPLPNTILEIKSEKGKHATQKPVPLMEYLIKYFTREGETVLDPTMGSGGTGIACKNLNRKFIGIEMDKDIFDVAVERNK